jgi:hypothetical protein
LLRRENSPAFNYYTLVRPELNTQNALLQLQQQTAANRQAITAVQSGGAGGLPPTGQPTYFMTYSHYFMSLGGTGAGRAGPVAPMQRTGPMPGGVRR